MRRPTQTELDAMRDEHMRRMAEPEPARSLRLQKERIEFEREQKRRKALSDIEAERLRREIESLGEILCA